MSHPRPPGLHRLADVVFEIASPLLRGKRFPLAEIRGAWTDLAGAQLAAVSRPERFAPGAGRGDAKTLVVRAASGAAALELQHRAPILVERINGALGFQAIDRLRLVQGPVAPPRTGPPPPPIEEEVEPPPEVASALADVENDRLRRALEALARRPGRPRR